MPRWAKAVRPLGKLLAPSLEPLYSQQQAVAHRAEAVACSHAASAVTTTVEQQLRHSQEQGQGQEHQEQKRGQEEGQELEQEHRQEVPLQVGRRLTEEERQLEAELAELDAGMVARRGEV